MHDISVVILTYNEEANIGRTLDALPGFREIILVDSYSTDRTVEIAQAYDNVTVHQRTFDNHSNQWNYGLSVASGDWILSLDADYVLSPALVEEIAALDKTCDSYRIRLTYCIAGKPLPGAILPPRTALFSKSKSHYIQDGHTQLIVVEGTTCTLKHPVYHDDRKVLDRWLWAQEKYTALEVQKLTGTSPLRFPDRIRVHTVFAPAFIFVVCYIFKGGFLHGRRGLYYALQRTYAELLILIRLTEYRLIKKK